MNLTAAQLVVYALEQLGITYTFGIPGVHNTEIYDALSQSKKITPILVTNEQAGAFIAEGMSRVNTSLAMMPERYADSRYTSNIGTLAIVPAAGLTHAASGIGEAYLDSTPMLVMTGGVRTDTPYRYKLHEVDQLEMAKGFTKAAFRVTSNVEVVETIFKAYEIATTGVPGPVLVEIPVNLQLFPDKFNQLPTWQPLLQPTLTAEQTQAVEQAVTTLLQAKQVGMFVGWGARNVQDDLVAMSELLQAPVATTLQGLCSFPAEHPLHVGMGFSPSAVPAAQKAFAECDAVLAIATRFSEIPTGSFGVTVPQTLVHCDIDPQVINVNYPASVAVVGDAVVTVPALRAALTEKLGDVTGIKPNKRLHQQILKDKNDYRKQWLSHNKTNKVNPIKFYDMLRSQLPADVITVIDDGNHTYLTAELFPIYRGGLLLTPTDFNAMGYAVPAAIGAKMAAPEREVVAVVGDGCFTMTCMEILTAKQQQLGIIYFVFKDGELSQIAQAQQIPYQEKACSILPNLDIQGVAKATGAAYFSMANNAAIEKVIAKARTQAKKGTPVIVDVNIDYSKKTQFTKGTSATTFKGFEFKDKVRFAKRVVKRKLGL